MRPDICQHPTRAKIGSKIPLALGAVTYVAQLRLGDSPRESSALMVDDAQAISTKISHNELERL